MSDPSEESSRSQPATGATSPTSLDDWRDAGRLLDTPDGSVFTAHFAPSGEQTAPPLLYIHGFPTCSFDLRHVLARLREHRHVVCFDQLGFGLSDKPDRRYGIRLHADTAERVLADAGIDEIDLLTHDMGDTVGGELLARDLEGELDVGVRRRVLTNGSIYLDLAQLTVGQQVMLSMPDASAEGIEGESFRAGLGATFSPSHPASDDELAAQWELTARADGHRLMTRTIRYLEDRQAEEGRFTGAIETHPSPLGVVWGAVDPVAVVAMVEQLASARPATPATILDDVGHYPMVEAPDAFADAVLEHLTRG